jgi:hypothetical protein
MHQEFDFTVRPPWAAMILFTLLSAMFLLAVIWLASGIGISGQIAGWRWL